MVSLRNWNKINEINFINEINDVWKDIVSQSYHFKSQPDLVTLGGVGGGGPKILQNA